MNTISIPYHNVVELTWGDDDQSMIYLRGRINEDPSLVADIMENGQKEPIVVSLPSRDGKHVIIDGRRRMYAIDKARWLASKSSKPGRANDSSRFANYDAVVLEVSFADTPGLIRAIDKHVDRSLITATTLGVVAERRKYEMGMSFAETGDSLGMSEREIIAATALIDAMKTHPAVLQMAQNGMSLGDYSDSFMGRSKDEQARVVLGMKTQSEPAGKNTPALNDLEPGRYTQAVELAYHVLIWLCSNRGEWDQPEYIESRLEHIRSICEERRAT